MAAKLTAGGHFFFHRIRNFQRVSNVKMELESSISWKDWAPTLVSQQTRGT